MKEKGKGILCVLGYLALWLFVQLIVGAISGRIGMIIYTRGMTIDEVVQVTGSIEKMGEMTTMIMPYMIIAMNIVIVGILWIITNCRKQKFREKLQFKSTHYQFILLSIGAAVAIYCFNIGLAEILGKMAFFKNSYAALEQTCVGLAQGSFVLTLLCTVVIAPIAEEIICRGYMYQTLSKRFSVKWAILLQAVIFGMVHINMIQVIYATVIGIVLGYFVYKSGSIWPAIIIHMVNNLLSVVNTMVPEGLVPLLILMVIGAMGIAATFVGMNKVKVSIAPPEPAVNEMTDSE